MTTADVARTAELPSECLIPSLIASDIDGTLLRHDETASSRTRTAIAGAQRAGLPLVLVTGRAPRWLPPVLTETGYAGPYVICCNGATVYHCASRKVISSKLIERSAIREVVARVKSALPGVGFAIEYGDRYIHEKAYIPRWDAGLPTVTMVEGPDELAGADAAKILIRHRDFSVDEFAATVEALVGDLVSITHGSGDVRLELSAAGVTKATGLAMIASELGVPSAGVAAFGDMPNDIPMLGWAGQSFAVMNAHPMVLEYADNVIPSNDDDGVAQVIEHWLGLW